MPARRRAPRPGPRRSGSSGMITVGTQRAPGCPRYVGTVTLVVRLIGAWVCWRGDDRFSGESYGLSSGCSRHTS
jgi:hypothetical protein